MEQGSLGGRNTTTVAPAPKRGIVEHGRGVPRGGKEGQSSASTVEKRGFLDLLELLIKTASHLPNYMGGLS